MNQEHGSEDQASRNPARRPFATTHWSIVLAAGDQQRPDSKQALETLCQTYWYPLYAYVRRRGYQPAEAQDLTQDFFAFLLSHQTLQRADKQRGRFRSFLLTSMQNFLNNQHRAAAAQKRGGNRTHISLDFDDGERKYGAEPSDSLSPEHIFERRWAITLMGKAIERLASEQVNAGKQSQWDVLKHYLGGVEQQRPYAEIASQLGMTANSVKVAVHRLRARCRELLRNEIQQTVDDEESIEDELRLLFQSIALN